MGLAALFGGDAADHVRPVRNGLLAVEGAGLAREALADDARVLVDPDLGRGREPARAAQRCGAQRQRAAEHFLAADS